MNIKSIQKKLNSAIFIIISLMVFIIIAIYVLENEYFFININKAFLNDTIESVDQNGYHEYFNLQIQDEINNIYIKNYKSVVSIISNNISDDNLCNHYKAKNENIVGTGIFVNNEGYIITNYHIIKALPKIYVINYYEQIYLAKSIKIDINNDLALLKIRTDETVEFVTFNSTHSIEIGDFVLAISRTSELESFLSVGVISCIKRYLHDKKLIEVPFKDYKNSFIQTDISYIKNYHGSPLFNIYGEVIGIMTDLKINYDSSLMQNDLQKEAGISFVIAVDKIFPLISNL